MAYSKELKSGILSLVDAIAILHGFSISLGAFSAGVYVLYFGKVERNSGICLRMCCCLEVNSFFLQVQYIPTRDVPGVSFFGKTM